MEKVLQEMSITVSNTIYGSPRFRLHTKLCLPAEEHKNPFLGLTSSSQEEVTRAMAITSEGKTSKAITLSGFLRTRFGELALCSVQLPL